MSHPIKGNKQHILIPSKQTKKTSEEDKYFILNERTTRPMGRYEECFFNVTIPMGWVLNLLNSRHILPHVLAFYTIRDATFSKCSNVLPQICGTDSASLASILLEETGHVSCRLGVVLQIALWFHFRSL